MTPKKDEYMRGYADGFKDGMAEASRSALSRIVYPVSAEISPRGWEFREEAMLEEAVRFLISRGAS
jgi:hypothetical protein